MLTTESLGGGDRRESTLATHRENLSEAIEALGLIETFEAVFSRVLDVKSSREDAAVFAHEVFLNTMRHWINA